MRNRQISARWCALAEKRLDHLTELFETGRWRRYYSERAFIENIREAKKAVNNWRALARGERIEKPIEISFVVEDDGFSLTRPLQKQADQSVRPEPPIRFDQMTPSTPTIETVIAAADIVVPEDMLAPDDVAPQSSAMPDHDTSLRDDDGLPADIILPDFVAAMPRIDMTALEEAMQVEAAEQDSAEQYLLEQDTAQENEADDEAEDEVPVLDLDAIERKYPQLRHAHYAL